MQLKPVAEQVVVVMGASSGIGRATALRFAEQGAKVVVAPAVSPACVPWSPRSRTRGGTATAVVADVADPGLTALPGLERAVVVLPGTPPPGWNGTPARGRTCRRKSSSIREGA